MKGWKPYNGAAEAHLYEMLREVLGVCARRLEFRRRFQGSILPRRLVCGSNLAARIVDPKLKHPGESESRLAPSCHFVFALEDLRGLVKGEKRKRPPVDAVNYGFCRTFWKCCIANYGKLTYKYRLLGRFAPPVHVAQF
jgi:hypothetical protein